MSPQPGLLRIIIGVWCASLATYSWGQTGASYGFDSPAAPPIRLPSPTGPIYEETAAPEAPVAPTMPRLPRLPRTDVEVPMPPVPPPVPYNTDFLPVPPAPIIDEGHGYGYDSSDFDSKSPKMKGFPEDAFNYRWQVWADAIFMTRSQADGYRLASQLPGGAQAFNTSDMDFAFRWGPHIGAYYSCSETTSVGVEFFGIDGWSAHGEATGNISAAFPGTTLQSEAGVAAFDYNSKLYSTEINVRRHTYDWLALMAGFRWIELGEKFAGNFTTDEPGASTYGVDVNNHLYGFQTGVLTSIRRNEWGGDLWAKTGIYANSANQQTVANVGNGPISVGADASNVAFAGEIGVGISRQFTDRLSARIGYQAMWLSGVAMAPEQLAVTNPQLGVAELVNDGSIFYHGGLAGMEYVW